MVVSYTVPGWCASIITGIAENENNDDWSWKSENVLSDKGMVAGTAGWSGLSFCKDRAANWKGQKPSLETLSTIASAFGVNVSDLSKETYVASQAPDERISEAKIQVAQETRLMKWKNVVLIHVLIFDSVVTRWVETLWKETSTQVRGFYCVFQSSCDLLRSHETTEAN